MSTSGAVQTALYDHLLASPDEVEQAITQMARQVIKRYQGQNPLFICLLRGGAPFASSLMKAVAQQDPHFHPEMDYMTISTYGDGRADSAPKLVMDVAPTTKVAGRTVVLLDDTLDKGITAAFAEGHLLQAKAASEVELLVLIQKNRQRSAYGEATMHCFESDGAAWLTGMGLDDTRVAHEGNRWAGFVAIANGE